MVSGWDLADLSPGAILLIPMAASARSNMFSGTTPVSLFSIKRQAHSFMGRLLAIRFFNRSGGACATHNDGDPVVAYDILSGRWILAQFVVGASPDFSHECVAVSQTEDATGAYYLYDFVTDPTNFVDYPKIGVWPDGYYMSGHVFNASGTAFLAGRIFVFEHNEIVACFPSPTTSG